MTDEIRCAIECREDETRQGPGRLVGRILRYGERANDRPELFERGALSWPADGVVLNRQHARGAPIMRVVPVQVGDELQHRSTVAGYGGGPRRGDRDTRRAPDGAVGVVSGGATVVCGRRAAYPVGDDVGGWVGRFSELRRARGSAGARPRKAAPSRVAMISAVELRTALGADAAQQGRVESIHMACKARVRRYAPGAPDAIQNEAMIVYAGWLYQATAQRRSVFPTDGEGPPVNVSRAFLLSGAQGLLSSWRVPRAGASQP